MRGWLSEKIPEHVCYVEPFAGAGHLLFSELPSKVEILNDIDNHLINFFQISQKPKKCGRLLGRQAFMPYSRALWRDIRNRWKHSIIPSNSVEAASEWFYLNRSTFSGDQKRGGFACLSITGRNSVQRFRNADYYRSIRAAEPKGVGEYR
ncbi:MAG: DNA adenine methylase, partial [Planctomycetota bacterium]